MRKFNVIVLMLILSLAVFAQKGNYFEGTVTYKMKLMGEGADQVAAFMPESMTFMFKDGSMKMKMNGGMVSAMMGEILVDGNKGDTYMVKHAEKTAIKLLIDDDTEEESTEKPDIEKLSEKLEISGYKTRKYKIVTTTEGEATTQYMWVTDNIKIKKPKSAGNLPSSGSLFIEGIEGFPLKIQSTMSQMGMELVMTMTAEEVTPTKFDKNEFSVPKGYEVEEKDPSSLFGM